MIYAHANEPVTCENGHAVGHFIVDVAVATPVKARDFVLADGSHPTENSEMTTCSQCGARSFRGGLFTGMLYEPAAAFRQRVLRSKRSPAHG